MERGTKQHFEAIRKAISEQNHQEINKTAGFILSSSPDDTEAKLCYIISCIRTDNLKDLQNGLFSKEPAAKEPQDIHLYYAYFLYLQGQYAKSVKHLQSMKASSKVKLLLTQSYYKNLEHEKSVQAMVELFNEVKKDNSFNSDDMLVNLFAACQGTEPSRVQKLIEEMKVGKTQQPELLFNLALLFRETKQPGISKKQLEMFVARLKEPEDHEDIVAARLLNDYILSFEGSLEDIEAKIEEYKRYGELENKNLAIVLDNNLAALRDISEEYHYDHLKKYDDYINGKYKQTRNQLLLLRLNRFIMYLKKNKMNDAGKALRELEYLYPTEQLLSRQEYLKAKVYYMERMKENQEIQKFLDFFGVNDQFIRFLVKAQPHRVSNNLSQIIELHKEYAKNKDFSANEVLNKYIFSILLKDQALFEKEVEHLYKQVQTTSDVSILKILREVFSKKGKTEQEVQILQKILKINPKDQSAKMLLARARLQAGDIEKCEELMKGVNKPDEITDMNYLQTLENNIHFSIAKKEVKKDTIAKLKKRIKKRRKRYPKNFDPQNPGPPPNPERWIPKQERKGYNKKRNFKVGRTQGATNVGKQSVNTYTATNTTSNMEVAKGKRKHRK